MKRLDTWDIGRRSLLGALSTGAAVAAAGCLGGESSEDDGDSEQNDAGEDGDNADEFPEHPMDEPRDPPAGRRCDGPCGMEPADYPEWNSQIAHDGGRGAFFDTPGCLLTYYNDPTFYDGLDSEMVDLWVRDFETKELIDARAALFVLDFDEERMDEPMAHNPKPFADREDAVAYVDSYDDLGEDDIVGIDGFGDDEAHRYRDYPISDS